MKDFPQWFIQFAQEQVQKYPEQELELQSKSDGDLMVLYLSLWSVVELFSKIVCLLNEKRNKLREHQAKKTVLEAKIDEFKSRLETLNSLINAYEQSIDEGILSSDELDVAALEYKFKRI